MDEVINFINRFTNKGKRTEVIDCFSNGCCYWFAHILHQRFGFPQSTTNRCYIVHDPVAGHFACFINDRIYDITGDITDQDREWDEWTMYELKEPKVARHIINSCALFIKEEIDNG